MLERRHRRKGLPRPLVAFLLALLAHFAFVGLLMFLSLVHVGEHAQRPPARPVSLRTLPLSQWQQNRGPARPVPGADSQPAPLAKAKPPEPKKNEPLPDGQVVDVAPGNGEESPDAKYLAERANKAQKETKAKEQTAFYRNAMPRRTTTVPQEGAGSDQVERPQIAGNNGMGNEDRPLREPGKKRSVFEVPDVKKRNEVAVKEDESGEGAGLHVANRTESAEVTGNSNRLKIQRGDQGEGAEESSAGHKGSPGIADLVPSMAVLDKLSGAAPNDHLGDVDEGEGTFLNTKEWKFASFFNRVKQGVGMHWDPGAQLRQRDPTGNIYGGRDRYTVINVTLNERGMVKDIYVEKSCGLDFLDLEAIRSFERAQPFPNPPPGLMANDSSVRFSFGFFLEMGGGPHLRLFRQGGG